MIYEHDLTDRQNDFVDALEDAVCSFYFGHLVSPCPDCPADLDSLTCFECLTDDLPF